MSKRALCLSILFMLVSVGQPSWAAVDLEALHRITLPAAPLDVAVSQDGLWIYVLTEDARLHIFSRNGESKGTVAVPEGARRIAAAAEEDVVLLANPDTQTVEMVRVNLAYTFTNEGSPTLGPAEAPVTLTLFTDFECTYCARLAPVLHAVHQAYPDKVRIVFKNFPLRMHRFAVQAALAALAAHEQGQFWPFHDRLFENYNRLNPPKIDEIREALGLDAERFKARMDDPALMDLIRRDYQEGSAAGVNGTPAIYINGKKYRGQRSLEGFREAIEALLAESD
jgi:protein-disulfide isomerase